jgi:preprotein translocase subunit SecD
MPEALQNPFVLWLVLSAALAALAYVGVRPELRTRAMLYGAFILACVVAMWPPYEKDGKPGRIRLGLDLRGGMHLVMQVQTDDALRAVLDDAVHSARERASSKGINVGAVERLDAGAGGRPVHGIAVAGIEPARVKDVRDFLRDDLGVGWDVRESGEGRVVAQLTEGTVARLREQTVDEAIRTLERRVNVLGVAEPIIAKHGNRGDQILVQLPGVSDPEQAKRIIQTTAQLVLKLVEDTAGTREALLQAHGGKVPEGREVYKGPTAEGGGEAWYLVRREAVITGRNLKNARVGVDENNAPDIGFSLNPAGAEKFKAATGRNVGRQLAIILDEVVYSAPVIQSQISGEGRISGSFTTEQADELAKILRAGALPASLRTLQELNVGASLGKDSIRSGIAASIAAMSFITLFMLVYYRLSGVNAVVALIANLVILLGAMAYAQATLTLPGIAGVILTVGVGVDTNVLVFERIREELRNGKTPKAAIAQGFDRVWITIIDTHATALIAAAFLFTFGTGPIKGFAVTLVWGLVANVFASYFVSKFLFEWVLGKRQVETLSI